MSTCVFLTTQPVMGTVAAEDIETGTPLVVTAHDYNPLLYYIDAAKGQEVRVTYDALGAAKVLYTPPPLIDPGGIPEPGQPTEVRTLEDVAETLFVYHGAAPPYQFNGQVTTNAAYVKLTHEPYVGFPAYKFPITCLYEHPRGGAIASMVKSDVFMHRDGLVVRLATLSRAMTGGFHEQIVPAGHTVLLHTSVRL